MRTVVAYQNWLFDFLRTIVMNPKNCPENLWGSVHLFLFLNLPR
jgi:uncharacterized protein YcsI (UPF0317 family)